MSAPAQDKPGAAPVCLKCGRKLRRNYRSHSTRVDLASAWCHHMQFVDGVSVRCELKPELVELGTPVGKTFISRCAAGHESPATARFDPAGKDPTGWGLWDRGFFDTLNCAAAFGQAAAAHGQRYTWGKS